MYQRPVRPVPTEVGSTGIRILTGGIVVTALVQTANAFTAWDDDAATRLLLAAAFALVGAAVAVRGSAPALGWTLVAVGAACAVATDDLVLVPAALFALALALFPTGRLPSPRWAGALAAAAPLGLALDGDWMLVALPVALVALAGRLRHPCEIVRRQVLCVLLGCAAALFALALDKSRLPGAWAVGALAIPLAIGVALLRRPLHDLDPGLKRLLVLAGLTACLAGVFSAAATLGSVAAAVLVAPLLALGVEPLRRLLHRAVDHTLYGREHDPYAVMTALGRHADAPADSPLVDVAATIAQSLALPYVAIELASGLEPAATWGGPAPKTVALELRHRGERVGTLRVAPHTVSGRISADELRLLEDLARQVAVTAHVVQLSQGLQRSREELVTTREEERRRLRRDLHDGLGPTLAAMTLRIDVALRLLEREPQAVGRQLVTLREESQRAIADIRRVAYGLRPPALDELGLIGAIEECTEQFGVAERLDLALDLPDAVPSLPAAIEVAALRIVQEALANVAHHSGARACGVRLEVHTAVAIEVSDDGEGLPEDYRAGIGLHSMRERAAELGGTCAIEPRRPRGTRVLAQLPLAVH